MMSRQLGFRSNVVYSWEHGRRHPEFSLFLRAAFHSLPGLSAQLAQFFELDEGVFAGRRVYSPRTVTRLVVQLVGSTAKTNLSAQIGVDRTTLGRWCAGRSEPRLPEFLALVQQSSQRLLPFVALFADPAKLPSTREVHRHLSRQRKLAYDLPVSHAVLRALELQQYRDLPRHSSDFLAREVGISSEDAERLLQRLVQAGLAVR